MKTSQKLTILLVAVVFITLVLGALSFNANNTSRSENKIIYNGVQANITAVASHIR